MADDNGYILKVTDLGVKLQNQTLLDHISFNVRKGTTIAILGPNGAGKTVLFRTLLNRIPHTGRIDWTEKVKIGYVPQYVTVTDVPMSVREFLSISSGNGMSVQEALSLVKLQDKSIADTRLGVLSGGQLRRVLIAWALKEKPDVLFLDEPTTGVDMTIFLITHDIHIIQEYADDLVAINKCVTFCGSSQDIAKPETQRIIYGEPVCVEAVRGET
jgi:zinc transport system ATP-binding protein